MKRLFISSLLTVAAVPFLMASPVPSHPQDSSNSTQTTKKAHKKHHKSKKAKHNTGAADTSK